MGRADLHIHTTYSDGMGTVPAVLEAASRARLDVIAITDHDQTRGALEALDLAPRYGITVIPGEEIATADGHLLALFVQRTVPAGLPLLESILRVADLGGICIAPHPMAQWLHSLSAGSIRRASEHPIAARTLVGIEVYNGSLPALRNNHRAQALGDALPILSQVANSDSHLLWTIGLCCTEYPGTTAGSLRLALAQRLTRPIVGKRPLGYYASFAKGFLLRGAGLAYWTPQPGKGIMLRRLAAVQP